jgi:hypothetical protein
MSPGGVFTTLIFKIKNEPNKARKARQGQAFYLIGSIRKLRRK